jgi:PAS domain S-box-containing protein
MRLPALEHEVARLELLGQYQIIGTPPEECFDDITRLAAYVCGTPIALIGFIDQDRQWFKSKVGWDVDEIPRKAALCAHTIMQSEVLVIPDTLTDEQTKTNVLATHGGVRFYAGVPLLTADEYALGTLCVMDSVSRDLTEDQTEALRRLARQVIALLDFRISRQEVAPRNQPTGGPDPGKPLADAEIFPTVTQGASDAIIVIDEQSTILFVNRSTERLFGYGENELLGRQLAMLLPDHLRQFHRQAMQSYLEAGKKRLSWQQVELPGLHKSGQEIFLEISFGDFVVNGKRVFTGICRDVTERKRIEDEPVRPIRDRTGEIIGASAVERDITDHKLAEEKLRVQEKALRSSEEWYRSLFEGAVYGIYRVEPEGQFLEVNPALVSMLGYNSADEVLKLNATTEIYADPQERARLVQKWLQGTKIEDEATWQRRDGTVITVRLTGRTLTDDQGVVQEFEFIAEDVTEQRSLEQELRQIQKIEAVGQLAGGIAHEFNNYLSIILGYSEFLIEEAGTNQSLRRGVAEIKAATQRAASLTGQLLAFSRKQVLEPAILDLNQVIREAHNLLRRLVPANIEIIPVLEPALGRVKADPGQIQQILINLALNARDAMPQGGKVIIETANAELDESYCSQHLGVEPGTRVLLAIRDTGCGMNAETLSHMFEPFFTTKEQGKGTGLGLSTIYGIGKQSGGHIDVESSLGEGTVFRIYLPRAEAPVEQPEPTVPQTEEPGASETILVVEDEVTLRWLIRLSLERRGYRVLAAKDGTEAIEICQRNPSQIRLVLSDIMMPHVNGLQLRERAATLCPDAKFLFMSGYSEEIIEPENLLAHGCAFLEKPFLINELVVKVRELLEGDAAA